MSKATATNKKWRRRSREEWQAVFARFAASGLGIESFCVREGLSASSFRRWKDLLSAPGPAASRRAPRGAQKDSGAAQRLLEIDPARPVVGQGCEGAPGPCGFVSAGTLKLGGTDRLELRLDLGDGVILHLLRG